MTEFDPITYQDSGVNYDLMDPFKKACQQSALPTGQNINRFQQYDLKVVEVTRSRGETAFEVEITTTRPRSLRIAHVEEGLGTKNEVANQLRELQSKIDLATQLAPTYGSALYRGVAIDNAAMVFNDLSTVGASPVSFMLHVAAYPSSWFADEGRTRDLIAGTVDANNQARCAWGGGESPALRDIINEGHSLLSGSAWGLKFPEYNGEMDPKNIMEQDRIILFGSSGPHSNGITLLRGEVLNRLPNGYETLLPDGKSYAEALLTPTTIYSELIDELYARQVGIKYATQISGHGWRKIMRAPQDLTYVIDKIPQPQPIFELVQDITGMSDEQIYGDYNMGAGLAIMVERYYVDMSLRVAERLGIPALDAGHVEQGPKRVIIDPLGVEFNADSLNLR